MLRGRSASFFSEGDGLISSMPSMAKVDFEQTESVKMNHATQVCQIHSTSKTRMVLRRLRAAQPCHRVQKIVSPKKGYLSRSMRPSLSHKTS